MQPVEPREVDGVPTRRVVFAEKQPQYNPLVGLVEADGRVHTRWKPSEDERRAIMDGACVTLDILTFNQPLQPLLMRVETGVWTNDPEITKEWDATAGDGIEETHGD